MTDRLGLLADAAVRSAVATELGRAIEHHAAIGSTQDRARELAPPALVVADVQTGGHGRGDRVWVAPAGSSLLASWSYPLAARPLASLAAGVAVARALDALGRPGATLKWPNDVLVGGRKVAGVLVHATAGDRASLVVGIGLNVSQRREDFPADLAEQATSLALEGGALDRLTLLVTLTGALDAALADEAGALTEWRARSAVLGRDVTIERSGDTPIRGSARDVAPDGALLVDTAAGQVRVVAGDVRLRI